MIVDDKTYLQYWHVTVSSKEWSNSIVPTSTWQTPTKPWHNSITSRLQVGQSSVLLIVATKNLRCGLISPLASPQTRAADDFEKTLRANAKQTGQCMFHSSYTGETRPVNKLRDKHEGHLIGQDQGISSISWKQDSKNLEKPGSSLPLSAPNTATILKQGILHQSHYRHLAVCVVNQNMWVRSIKEWSIWLGTRAIKWPELWQNELLHDHTQFHLLEQWCVAFVLREVRKSRTWRPHSSGTCPIKMPCCSTCVSMFARR